jgi:FKBP-type peptidyl-prolyl cis-trans isomerase FklB
MSRQSVAGRGAQLVALTALLGTCAPTFAGTAETPSVASVAPEAGSYDVGLLLGSQLDHDGLNRTISIEALIRGMKDALGGRAMNTEEREAALRFMRAARDSLSEKNRGLAQQFLERNGKEPGIVTMPSGLQYRVLAAGDASGKSPMATDQVTVRYRASLADGTEYDRSDSHDRAATFRVNSVFKGWQQAFLAMKPGAKWQLFVPPELGYGNNSPPMVPPGSLLVYELELLKVEPAPPMDPTPKHPVASH